MLKILRGQRLRNRRIFRPGHEWCNIVPPEKYGNGHLEYFALVDGRRDSDFENFDGKHGAQLCTSNPEIVSVFSEYFDRFFAENPEIDALHVTPNDGGRFCQCNNCTALDTGKRWRKNPEKPVITDRIFTFNNELAKELKKKHPGKYLVNMAYSWYFDPPEKIKVDDQIIPQYCMWSCYKHWEKKVKEEHYSIAKGWTDAAKNVGIYEYFINGAWPDLPRLIVPKIEESLKYLHSIGIKLYQCQAGDGYAINGLNYYVASKLWWNIDTNVDALLEDFYKTAFGKAGKYIERYYERFQTAWQVAVSSEMNVHCSSFAQSVVHKVYTPDLLKDCRKDLQNAYDNAETQIIKRRIEFVEKGLKYVELTIDAVIITKELESKGVTISAHTFTDEEELTELERKSEDSLLGDKLIKGLIDKSLAAWEKRDIYVESLKDDYVISYFWIKYNDCNRVFNPVKRLKDLKNRV